MSTPSASNTESKPKALPDLPPDGSVLRSWVVPVATAAALTALFCVYYFVYVSAQRKYLVDRNFRSLAALGDHIQRVVSTHGSILEFYADLAESSRPGHHEHRQEEKLDKFLLTRPEDINLKDPSPESRKDYLRFLAPSMELSAPEKNPAAAPRPRLDVQRRDGRWWLELSASRSRKDARDYVGSLDIDLLLKSATRSLPFDDILLVSENGNVVYEMKKAGPQFTTLSSLLKARVNAVETKPAVPEKSQDTSIHLTEVMVAGTHYELFLQPILIDTFTDQLIAAERPRDWTLCGLRSVATLQWESLSISYTGIIWFTALFFAICMGGPLLKLIFMNQRERLRLRELGFLALFVVMLAGVFTLTALEMGEVRAASDTDVQLQSLAVKLSRNVHDDLRDMRAQLLAWCGSATLRHDLDIAKDHEVIRNTPGSAISNRSVGLTPQPSSFPFAGNAFWTDDDGHQVIKWSTSGYVTPMIDVSVLPAFSNPKRIYLDGAGPQFHVDSILPPNKLEYLAALTVATKDCVADPKGLRGDLADGAAFITSQPFSLIDPILPSGYGFALVDDTGRVLFHSDQTKDGRENFREESEWNRELYSSTFGHATAQPLTINYLGRDFRARVVPIPGIIQAPWSLIVYADLAEERTLALQTMSMASSLFLAVLAAPALVVAIWCLWIRPRFAPEWLWPNQHRVETYFYQICVYIVLIALFLFVGFHGPAEQIVIACVAVPYTALLLTYWCYRRYPAANQPVAHRDTGRSDTIPGAFSVLAAAIFLALLFLDRQRLMALAALPAVAAIAAIPFLDGPRRYILAEARRRRKLRQIGAQPNPRAWPFLTHAGGYMASMLLLLLLLGVLTPMALFRACLTVESRLGVKRAQLRLADAVAQRRALIMEKCASAEDGGEVGLAACRQFEKAESDVLEKIAPNPARTAGRGPRIVSHNMPAGQEFHAAWFRRLVYVLHHGYNDTAAETLAVIQDRLEPNSGGDFPGWSWTSGPSTVELRWHGIHPARGSQEAERDLLIASDVPAALLSGVTTAAGVAIGVMLLIGGVLWMLVHKVFLVHITPLKMTGVRELAECIRTGQSVLILVPPASDFQVEAAAKTLDLRALADQPDWAEKLDLEELQVSGLIEIRNLQHKSHAATLEQKKILLQRLLQRAKTQIAAILRVPASSKDYRTRFPMLTVVDLRDEPLLWLKQYEGPAKDQIWRECWPMPALWPMGVQLAEDIRSETKLSDDTIATEILERADAYYRLVWKECSDEQKFVLSQLAEDGLMNPLNGRTIRQMLRKGLIVQDPEFRIMNESFRRFLTSATTTAMKQHWLSDARRTGWGKLHGAFFTTMIVLGIFLLTTQNALWESSAAYVTTAFGALGTVARFFNSYRGVTPGEKAN